jgi:signal transduction histidine kinase
VEDPGAELERQRDREGGVVIAVRATAGEPLALRARVAQALRTLAYVVLTLPLGIVGLLAPLAMFLGAPGATWRVAALERRLANALLGARIPPLPLRRSADAERRGLTSGPGTNAVILLLMRLPVAIVAAAAAAVPLLLTLGLVRYGVEGLTASSDQYVGPWRLDVAAGIVLVLLALAAAVVSVAVLDGMGTSLRELARRFLVTSTPGAWQVREALAESIGDATLAIAYWLPDRGVFVDEHGLPIELPEQDSGRAWTAVEHEGTRLAAIIHDAELYARPELVRAAAAGAVLALDNERLKADLRARVEELRASRARIVEASLDARRRLERDLHDGAQQQLVALSLDLQLIRARVAGDREAATLVEASIEKLASALSELRELARGIHPAILTDRGLDAALAALVDRTPVPVDTEVAIDERVAPAIEAAAYFVVAEALTNVVKYAQASRASVTVRREDGVVAVEIADDGIGGAAPAKGSGLRGLEDRVAALDGTLAVDSPPGQGTCIVARFPAAPPR